MALPSVVQFYKSVIDDVVNNIRETFLDDGVDEQVLLELKQVWENKLAQSKAVPTESAASEAPRPPEKAASHHSARGSSSSASSNTTSTSATTAGTTTATTSSSSVSATPAAASTSQATVQPTLQYHYTTAGQDGSNEASKSVTFTLPQTVAGSQKPVTITLPPHVMQTGLMMSSSAAPQALPTTIATGLNSHPLQQQSGDGVSGATYQLTADQHGKQGYMLSMTQGSTSTTTTTSSHMRPKAGKGVIQLDGVNDTSDEDDDDDEFKDDDADGDDDEQNEEDNEGIGEEEEPLNSEDDVSDEDPSELFDTDNVIVCQYDKITRSRNKWKFHLKDGIMNLQGRDFIFQKALGDAEW